MLLSLENHIVNEKTFKLAKYLFRTKNAIGRRFTLCTDENFSKKSKEPKNQKDSLVNPTPLQT